MGSVEIRIDQPNEEGIGEVLIRGPIVMPFYCFWRQTSGRMIPIRKLTEML
ncbi:MAG: hypothetical protein EBV02_04330, partial [Actinobacteria bacterium]|nr:hypothetical protein [Actinomycetota bacterium]